jgi:hypothetical protein
MAILPAVPACPPSGAEETPKKTDDSSIIDESPGMGHEISLISAGEGKETGDASFPVIQTA